jgi:hypothetical protein
VKLRAKNLSLSIECEILIDENVKLLKKCFEVIDGTINANQGREMAIEALMNIIQKSKTDKKQTMVDSLILVDAMQVSPPPNDVEDRPAQ